MVAFTDDDETGCDDCCSRRLDQLGRERERERERESHPHTHTNALIPL